jgi:hypothetical protein
VLVRINGAWCDASTGACSMCSGYCFSTLPPRLSQSLAVAILSGQYTYIFVKLPHIKENCGTCLLASSLCHLTMSSSPFHFGTNDSTEYVSHIFFIQSSVDGTEADSASWLL